MRPSRAIPAAHAARAVQLALALLLAVPWSVLPVQAQGAPDPPTPGQVLAQAPDPSDTLPRSLPPYPGLPQPSKTGVLAVDEAARALHRQANEAGESTWQLVGSQAGPVLGLAADPARLEVFHDGFGDDGSLGGFGAWTVLGSDAWQVEPGAAHAGGAGYALARPDGTYPMQATSMLLSPEVDLRTGMPDAAAHDAVSNGGLLGQIGRGVNSVLDAIAGAFHGPFGTLHDTLQGKTGRDVGSDPFPTDRVPPLGTDLPESGNALRLSFDLRMNVQAGRDAVQLWLFTEKPDAIPPACTGCHLASATLAYDSSSVRARTGSAAWTGFHDWTQVKVDLANYAGKSVWFGLVFAGTTCPTGCLGQPTFFDQGAGFTGVQLDDASVRVPAGAISIRLRPFAAPSIVPEGTNGMVTVPPGDMKVLAELANVGRTAQTFNITFQLSKRGGDAVGTLAPKPVTLAPGQTAVVPTVFRSVAEGNYTLDAALDGPQADQDPSDNSAHRDVDVKRIESARLLEVVASADQVRRGEPLQFGALVQNLGNVPLDLVATPTLRDVTDSVTTGRAPTDASGLLTDPSPVLLDALPPGAKAVVRWTVATTQQGQFQLHVGLSGPGVPAPPADGLDGTAVGVDRSPPPVFYQGEPGAAPRGDLAAGTAWEALGALGPDAWRPGTDYVLAPGTTFYLGKPASATCGASVADIPAGCDPFISKDVGGGGSPVGPDAELRTPPILVDAASTEPHLRFEHQFATFAAVRDCLDWQTTSSCAAIRDRSQAYLEGRRGSVGANGAIDWTPWVTLRSKQTPIMRGTAAEETLGILNPEHPRDFQVNNPCAPDRSFEGKATGWGCDWWWPSGLATSVQMPGQSYPQSHLFTGSPWLLEDVDLTAPQGEDANVAFDARGMVFQARFRFPHFSDISDTTLLDPHSEGWRIGAVEVTRTSDRLLDLAATGIEPLLTYDPAAIGLGPDTDVRFAVAVANRGALPASGGTVRIDAVDPAGQVVASGTSPLPDLEAGAQAAVNVTWHVPADAARVRLRAHVDAGGQDDFPGDNERWGNASYAVQAFPDIAPVADVVPRLGSLETVRSMPLAVENRGNVPVNHTEVTRVLARLTGLSQPAGESSRGWRIDSAIPPGGRATLGDPSLTVVDRLPPHDPIDPFFDLSFTPPRAAEYREVVRVALAGQAQDGNASNDEARVPFRVTSVLYRDTLESTPQADAAVVHGKAVVDPTVWSVQPNGARHSAHRLDAGDPATGEIPANADSSYVLPPLDLSAVRSATLTFQHRFTLESGFDAARVEVSTDGGATWEAAPPRSDPSHGLPLGYSTQPLLADSPLADGRVAPEGAAYTGDSRLLPNAGQGADAGWIPAEFDLSQVPSLQRQQPVAAFSLRGLAADATLLQTGSLPVRNGTHEDVGGAPLQWTDPSWRLAEPDAAATERYWWIDNQTFRLPSPVADPVWWSGSQGSEPRKVDTTLTLTLPSGAGGAVRWWDWRDGWRDGEHPQFDNLRSNGGGRRYALGEPLQRDGTGGSFLVDAVGPGGATPLLDQVTALDRRDDGWTLREVTVPPGTTALSFHYVGDRSDQADRGWFLGNVTRGGASAIPAAATRNTGTDGQGLPFLDTAWRCIGSGSALGSPCTSPKSAPQQRPGGWHVENDTLADGARGPTWRFADGSSEGYPAGASARLVTPVVDLSSADPERTVLTFDHRYGFQADPGCLSSGSDCTSSSPPPPLGARDAGMVEVQVLDERTGSFGPWQALVASQPDDVIPFVLQAGPSSEYADHMALMAGKPATQFIPRYSALGYPAAQAPILGSDLPRLDLAQVRAVSSGLPYTMPLAPVFSGESLEWSQPRFDLSPFAGQKVRFAFHAWTDSIQKRADPYLGWELSNVQVVTTAFQGKPALVRLHVATDQSLPKGDWSLDDIEVTGDVFRSHLAILPDAGALRAQPGTAAEIFGNISNLASEPRNGLALRVVAEQGTAGVPVLLVDPVLENVTGAPEGVDGLRGTLDLLPGESRPFHLLIPQLPSDPGTVQVHIRLYQDVAPQAPGHTPRFAEPADEVPSSTQATITIATETVRSLAFAPPRDDTAQTLVASPPQGSKGHPVELRVRVANTGTTEEDADVSWTVTQRITADPSHPDTPAVHLKPGEARDVTLDWTPDAPGVYRVKATVNQQSGPAASIDVPVDTSLLLFRADTTSVDNWTLEHDAGDGTSEAHDQWRSADGALLWGVRDREFDASNNYCLDAGQPLCPAPNQGVNTGPSASAATGAVDLRAVPGDRPMLALRHTWAFAPGDGGTVEAALYGNDRTTPLCQDANGDPEWMRLTPVGGYPGQTSSGVRANRLGAVPAFTGSTPGGGEATTLFDLAAQDLGAYAASCQGKVPRLVGNFVSIRLHAGAQALSGGDRGWSVRALAIGTGAIAVGPHQSPDRQGFERIVPVRDGAAKRFLTLVRNDGPVGDTAVLGLGADATAPASWVTFPRRSVPLQPGQAVAVPVQVEVPPEDNAARTTYALPLEAHAAADPGFSDTLLAGLQLVETRLPDLNVQLRLDGADEDGSAEAGSSLTLTAVVSNLGEAVAEPVEIVFTAQSAHGAEVLHRETLPALCPASACGRTSSFAAISTEWITPELPGDVVVRATVDAAGRLTELRRDNDQAALLVPVHGTEAPDVAILDLGYAGAGADGFIEAGSFLRLNATVANVGRSAAQDVRVQILLGSAVVAEELIRQLTPGAQVNLTAIKAAPAGDLVLRAIAVSGSERADANPDNDQATRVLRVRSHGVVLEAPGSAIAVSPDGHGEGFLRVRNEGNAPDRLQLSLVDAPGWNLTAYPDPVQVLPGTSLRVFVTLDAPPGTAAGAQLLKVRATPTSAPTQGATVSLPIAVGSNGGGLALEPAGGRMDGGTAVLDVVVRNAGNSERQVHIAVLGDAGATDVVVPPASAVHATVRHAVEAVQGDGPLHLPLVAFDASGTLATAVADLLPGSVVILDSAWGEPQPVEGSQDVRYTLDVANHGNLAVHLLAVPVGLVGAEVLPERVDLAPGQSAAVELRTFGPADPALPGHLRLVRAEDPADLLADAVVPVPPQRPNLEMRPLQVPDRAWRGGDRVPLDLEVRNNGTAAAPAGLILVYHDAQLVAALERPALAPGDAVTLQTGVRVDQGRHAIIALATGVPGGLELHSDDNGAGTVLDVGKGGLMHAAPGPGLPLLVLAVAALALLLRRRA